MILILSSLRVVDVASTSNTHSRILTFAFSLLIKLSGFANLPNQLYRKSVKDGFEFSLMVVGESGLGKSTLTNSLFLTDVYSDEYPGPSQRVKKTLEVQKTALSITENGIKLNLTVVDTPGFGDNVRVAYVILFWLV